MASVDPTKVLNDVCTLLSELKPEEVLAFLQGYAFALKHARPSDETTAAEGGISRIVVSPHDPLHELHFPGDDKAAPLVFAVSRQFSGDLVDAIPLGAKSDGDPNLVTSLVVKAFNQRNLALNAQKSPAGNGLSAGGWNSMGTWIFDRISATYPKFQTVADYAAIDDFFNEAVTAFIAYARNCIRKSA